MSTERRSRSKLSSCRELPSDIVEEILLKLPAKHVVRCKLLSKTYHALIEDSRFIDKHLRSRTNDTIYVNRFIASDDAYNPIVSLRRGDKRTSTVYVPPHHKATELRDVHLVGSCNGLLCVQVVEPFRRRHTIWNPTTRERLQIPSIDKRDGHGRLSYKPDTLGFGYDARHGGEYKLVRIRDYSWRRGTPRVHFSAEVWTMKTNKWKEIGYVLPDLLLTKERRLDRIGLSIGGSLFWLAHHRRVRDAVMVSFDMSDDTFREITMPPHIEGLKRYYMAINNFSGSLALIMGLRPGNCEMYDVWVMDGNPYNSSSSLWTKKFSIGPLSRDIRLTGACMNGNFVMKERRDEHCRFLLYNPYSNREVEDEFPSNGVYESRYDYEPFCSTESLVSMKQHIGQRSKRKS